MKLSCRYPFKDHKPEYEWYNLWNCWSVSTDGTSSLSKLIIHLQRIDFGILQRINELTFLEEYIILLYQTDLDPLQIWYLKLSFLILIWDTVSNFSVKIPFEKANSRCVACEGSIKGKSVQKENKFFNVSFESKIQLSTSPIKKNW